MTLVAGLRIALVLAVVGVFEVLCRIGVIDNFTMPPPSRILLDLGSILASGKLNAPIARPWGTPRSP